MKLSLGALDENDKYVSPSDAEKTKKYKCPDCDAPVIVKQGDIRIHHFAHFVRHSCEYFERPSEAQIHKDGKLAIKNRLETTGFIIERNCSRCSSISFNKNIPKQDRVEIEYRFEHNEQIKIADLASFNGDKRIIFEILNTHRTDEDDRSGEWYEIKALNVHDNILKCERRIKCSTCIYNQKREDEEFIKRWHEDEERKEQRNRLEREKNERIAEEIKRIDELKKEKEKREEEQKKIEQERRIKLEKFREDEENALQEYTKEIVDTYQYDPTISYDGPNNIMYKGFDFLHPYYILRMRYKKR